MRTPSDRLRLPHPRWQKGTSKFPQRERWREGGEVRAGDSSRTPRLLWEQEQLWLGAQAAWAILAKKPCCGEMSEHVSINQWTDPRNPSMSLSTFQAGRVCASLSMLSQSWMAWGQPAGETGHGSNKSTDRQTPGLPCALRELSSLTLNGIEKLEWYWISLCGTLTIQPVREFI